VKKVKSVFAEQPEVFNSFLQVMKKFKEGRCVTRNISQLLSLALSIDLTNVVSQVSQLFEGYPELLISFNDFVPPAHRIPVTHLTYPEAATPTSEVERQETWARNYVTKIKQRFHNDPRVYRGFLEILHGYHKGTFDIQQVKELVAQLFQDNQVSVIVLVRGFFFLIFWKDLYAEFQNFLPPRGGKGRDEEKEYATRERTARLASSHANGDSVGTFREYEYLWR